MRSSATTRDLVYIALFAVILAVCAWISIPAAVPFTMQTFGVFLTLSLLGGKRGTAAIAVYILLGALGVPVFHGFTGGMGILLGATGGYIVGFLLTGLLYWLCAALPQHKWTAPVALLLGLIACYVCGTFWYMAVYARGGGAVGFTAALLRCVVPFIVPDILKLALALLSAKRLAPHMQRAR